MSDSEVIDQDVSIKSVQLDKLVEANDQVSVEESRDVQSEDDIEDDSKDFKEDNNGEIESKDGNKSNNEGIEQESPKYSPGSPRREIGESTSTVVHPKEGKLIDHQGLVTSDAPQTYVYPVKQETSFHITRALFIANLRRPLSAIHFQNYLKELAEQAGGYSIERAWLNRTRSHGIVLVDREEGATFIREKLLGSVYPKAEEDEKLKNEYDVRELERFQQESKDFELSSDSKQPAEIRNYSVDRFPLYVDYIPVKALSQWVFEEDKGPRNGEWKVEYEDRNGEIIVSHTLVNGDAVPRYSSRGRGRGNYRGNSYRGDHRSDYRDNYREQNYYRRENYGTPRSRAYNRYEEFEEKPNDNSGPRPYHTYPPRNPGGNPPRNPGRGARRPERSDRERDFYVPGNKEKTSYDRDHRSDYRTDRKDYDYRTDQRTDSYQPKSSKSLYEGNSQYERSTGRSRSPQNDRRPRSPQNDRSQNDRRSRSPQYERRSRSPLRSRRSRSRSP